MPPRPSSQEVSVQSGGGSLLRRGSPGLATLLMTGPATLCLSLLLFVERTMLCLKLNNVKCVIYSFINLDANFFFFYQSCMCDLLSFVHHGGSRPVVDAGFFFRGEWEKNDLSD